MTVNLTNTTKKHNSTFIPSSFSKTVTCTLKEGSSIINPVLIFERANVSHTYNYVYISDFGRYYFVRDVVYNGAQIYYYCNVDVLASYKSTIGASSQYVLRSAAVNNEYVIDNYYPVTTHTMPYKDIIVQSPWFDYGQGHGRWVVGVINNDGVTYYCFTSSNYKDFLQYLLSDAFMSAMGIDLSVNPQLRVAADPIQYITCCFWCPFTSIVPNTSPAEDRFNQEFVKVAKVTTNITAGNISASTAGFTIYDIDLTIAEHPQAAARGGYLNSSKFSECRLTFPPFGAFDLNLLELVRYERVRCMVQVDCTTGIGKLLLYGYINSSDGVPACTFINAEAQIGVPMPVTQIITPGVSPVQLGLQAAGAIASAAMGNIAGAIAGGASAIESYQAGKIPKSSVIGSRGSISAIHGYAIMEYMFYYVTANDIADHGQPLCEVYQLSTLAGYQMILNPHIHTTGTAAEDEKINNYLATGYFYE